MLKYEVGDKVVPVSLLEASPLWFEEEYVVITEIYDEGTENEHYCVGPKSGGDAYSWLAEDEINHEATEALNK